jgi:hypothetical protein
MKPLITTALFTLLLAFMGMGQTTTSTPTATSLPTYIMAGLKYDQFTGGSGFVSGIVPESDRFGVYGSATVELVPVKFIDPPTGNTRYLLGGSARFGQHKTGYNDGKNMLLFGGDVGASFSSSSSTAGNTATVSLGMAGSFTITYVRQLSPHWALGVPVRMLWMSGVGPNGSGAWNPVVELGIVWKP